MAQALVRRVKQYMNEDTNGDPVQNVGMLIKMRSGRL